MGLAICRSIIETDQGRLWLALRQVPGVTVGFTIPLQPKTENDSGNELTTGTYDFHRGRSRTRKLRNLH